MRTFTLTVLAAAMLVPISLGTPAAAMQVPLAHSTPKTHASSEAPLLGATIDPWDYGSATFPQAARKFDSYTGTSMATTVAKRYLTDTYPSRKQFSWQFQGAHEYVVNVEPGFRGAHGRPVQSAAERAKLVNFVQAMQRAGINAVYSLWNEASNPAHGSQFRSAAEYISWFRYYSAPLQRIGATVVWDAAGYEPTIAAKWYPGDKYVDQVAEDYYCNAYRGWHTHHARLSLLASIADNHKPDPIPFGLAEFGIQSGPANIPMTISQFASCANYVHTFFAGREAAGQINSYLIYFGSGPTRTRNRVTSPSDSKIPVIHGLYNDMRP